MRASLLIVALAMLTASCAPGIDSGRVTVPLRPGSEAETLEVYWELAGLPLEAEAPVILVFHGGPGFPQAGWWRLPFWSELGRKFSLLYFHHRGSGRSSPLPGDFAPPDVADAYSLENIVQDAEALRRAVLGPDRPVVVFGQSAGGQLAVIYAARFPRVVRHVVLVSTAIDHRWVSEQRANLEGFLDELVEAFPEAKRGLEQVRAGGICEAWTPDTLPFQVLGRLGYTHSGQVTLRRALWRAGEGDPEPLCRLAASPVVGKATTRHALYRTIACRQLGWGRVSPANCTGVAQDGWLIDLRQLLFYIHAPLLLISSRHDPIVPPALQRELFGRAATRKFVFRPRDVGHDPLAEAPELCLERVLSYLLQE